MLVGSKTVGIPRPVPDLSSLGGTGRVLVDARAALREVGFNGLLYHRAKSTWEGPIELTRARADAALGPGFYTSTAAAPPGDSTFYGRYLKLLELPEEALEGKTAMLIPYVGSGDKQGASLTVQLASRWVVVHDTDLIDAATVHPFFEPKEVFPTSAPRGR